MRVFIENDPFLPFNLQKNWRERGLWPASWISCPAAATPPFVTAFRREVVLDQDVVVRLHVTADERYHLYLDGERVGQGPERGAPDRWYYESYEFHLSAGRHLLVARTWALGQQSADAQMSVSPGFLLAATDAEGQPYQADQFNTGVAEWETKLLHGVEFMDPPYAHWKGATLRLDAAHYDWDFERSVSPGGIAGGWQPAQILRPGCALRIDWELRPRHLLHPATLPPMWNAPVPAGIVRFVCSGPVAGTQPLRILFSRSDAQEEAAWTALLRGEAAVQIPPQTRRRVLLDLQNYYCAFPEVIVSGGEGAILRLLWAESLYMDVDRLSKGQRDEVDGKFFFGQGDVFLPDGGRRRFEPLWWSAGRYVEILVETGPHPMTVERLAFHETRYPLEMQSSFQSSDPRLEQIIPLLTRGLQMCSHETFFDCPYYEELQYAGDTRLEALVTYVMARDDRLARKALDLFDVSRLASGLTQSRYPCRVMQIISSWTLWWVAMVRDYAYWRTDVQFVLGLMPGVRATMEGFRRFFGQDGLLHAPEGWNNFDWVPEWDGDAGCPPDAVSGVSGVLNWHYIYLLTLYSDLEERLDEPLLAERAYWQAVEMAEKVTAAFWDEGRGLLADDLAHQHFSEHTQCLALLSGLLQDGKRRRVAHGLLNDPNLSRMTVYASFYLFETLRKLGRVDVILERWKLWFDMPAQGFKTPLEKPEPSRSDCHGWGAHPLYHYYATILGIRPGDLGFCSVEITPQLGPLQSASGRLVHPAGGEIVVQVQSEPDGHLHGRVSLPPGVGGMLNVNGRVEFLPDGAGREF